MEVIFTVLPNLNMTRLVLNSNQDETIIEKMLEKLWPNMLRALMYLHHPQKIKMQAKHDECR